MKKILLIITILTALLSSNVYANTHYGYDIPVTVSVNSNVLDTDNASFIINNTAYAPVRFILNALGIYEMEWKDDEKSVTFSYEGKDVKLYAGYKYAFVNGEKIPVSNNIVLKNKRTLAPIRFISELFDFNVNWSDTFYIVDLSKENIEIDESLIEKDYSLEDIVWLSRIIEAEGSGEPFNGKIAVGNVILNRVESKDFPDTIYDVIFDNNYGIQFQPVANNSIYNTPSRDSVLAGKLAIRDTNIAGESLYFLNPKKASNFWIINNRTYHKTINNHDFYL